MSTFNVATKVSKFVDTTFTIPLNGNVNLFTVPSGYVYKINAFVLKDTFTGITLDLRLVTTDGTFIDKLAPIWVASAPAAVDDPIYNVRAIVAFGGGVSGALVVFKQPLILSEGQGLNAACSGAAGQTRKYAILGEIIQNTL
jgi:hypothetical protein